MKHKDVFLLQTIVIYCDELASAIREFSIDEATVTENPGIRAMVAFFCDADWRNC